MTDTQRWGCLLPWIAPIRGFMKTGPEMVADYADRLDRYAESYKAQGNSERATHMQKIALDLRTIINVPGPGRHHAATHP